MSNALKIVTYSVEYRDQALALAREMHAESASHRFMRLNEQKLVEQFRRASISEDAYFSLAVRDGAVLGGLLGVIYDQYFSDERAATELAWFMSKSARGSSAAVRLLHHFEEWASARGARAVLLGQSTGVDIDRTTRLYGKLGYMTVGVNTMRVL